MIYIGTQHISRKEIRDVSSMPVSDPLQDLPTMPSQPFYNPMVMRYTGFESLALEILRFVFRLPESMRRIGIGESRQRRNS